MKKLLALSILALSCGFPFAQTKDASQKNLGTTKIDIAKLANATNDKNAPAVYFSREISSESILKLYKATGKKLSGKIALKVIFEGPGIQHLDPALLAGLAKETRGTFIDSTYYTSPRNRPDGSLKMAGEHGWDKIAPCEIIDKDGDMKLPVNGGSILKYSKVGKDFAKYDAAVAVMLFKPHYLPQYDGMTKALTIPFASRSGKTIIHTYGEKDEPYYSAGADLEKFQMAVADATKAAHDAKPWIYIQVLADICVDDSCRDAKPLGNIGVLASADPIAIDRAACDMTFGQGTAEQTRRWEDVHGVTTVMRTAEKIGLGKQKYRIIEVK